MWHLPRRAETWAPYTRQLPPGLTCGTDDETETRNACGRRGRRRVGKGGGASYRRTGRHETCADSSLEVCLHKHAHAAEVFDQPLFVTQLFPCACVCVRAPDSVWVNMCVHVCKRGIRVRTCSRVSECSGEGLEDAPKQEAGITSGRRGCGTRVFILMLLLCLSFTSVGHLKEH